MRRLPQFPQGGTRPPDGWLKRAPQKTGPEARFHRRKQRGAFTLVETLLALALLTSVLVAVNMFLFSMGELWGRNRQERLFQQHVRAVTHRLDDLLARAALVMEPGRELRLAAPKGSGLGDPRITFELADGDRLLPWPDAPLPDVECSLAAEPGRGLVLSWQSRWETGFEQAAPRTVVVSPLVRQLDYLYFDDATRGWNTTTTPVRGAGDAWPLPARLRLHFQYDRFSTVAVVTIPPRLPALPAF